MAETVARRGGLAVLPQDIPVDIVETVVDYLHSRHPVYDTPITLPPTGTVGEALSLIHKRSHGVVIVVEGDEPVGVFTETDAGGFDRFTQLRTSCPGTSWWSRRRRPCPRSSNASPTTA